MELNRQQEDEAMIISLDQARPAVRQIQYYRDYEHGQYLGGATLSYAALSCEEVEDLFIEPFADMVRTTDPRGSLFEGLHAYVSDDSVVHGNANELNRETRVAIRKMTVDLRRILKMLEDNASQTSLTRTIRTASYNDAQLYARERLLALPSRQLLGLCEQLGMKDVDQVGLWRETSGARGKGELRMYHLDEHGADSEVLRSYLITSLFRRMDVLSPKGIETLRVHSEDIESLPQQFQRASFGEKQRYRGAPSHGDWLPRWDISFKSDGIARRKIVPVISWAAVGDDSSYNSRRKKFNWLGSGLQFDERSRTLTLFSPVVGALLLARDAKANLNTFRAGRFFLPFYDPRFVDQVRRGRRRPLPPETIAGMPVVLAEREAGAAVLAASGLFKQIHRLVTPSYDELRFRFPAMRRNDWPDNVPVLDPKDWPMVGQAFYL